MRDFWEEREPDDLGVDDDGNWILLAGNFAVKRHPSLEPGDLIRRLRRGARITQTVAARGAGLQRTRACEIERGRADPRWSEVVRLLRAVGCEPVLLATGPGWTPGVGRWRRVL